jgi:hypothetical protein
MRVLLLGKHSLERPLDQMAVADVVRGQRQPQAIGVFDAFGKAVDHGADVARACSAAIPLDLSDEIVTEMSGDTVPVEDVAQVMLMTVTEGVVYKTTLTRARALVSHIQDAILEIALGVNTLQ